LQFFIAGLVIAGLLTLPVVNMVAPLLGRRSWSTL
jgi:hypothetical protein